MPLTVVNQDAPPDAYVAACGDLIAAVSLSTSSPWVNTFTLFDPASDTSQVYSMSALPASMTFGQGSADPAGDSAWFAGFSGSTSTVALVRIFPDATYTVWTMSDSGGYQRFAAAGPTHVYVGRINHWLGGRIFNRSTGTWVGVTPPGVSNPRIVPQWYGGYWYTGYDSTPQRVSTSGTVINLTGTIPPVDDAPAVNGTTLVMGTGERWDMATESSLSTVALPGVARAGDADQVVGCDSTKVWTVSPASSWASVANPISGHGNPRSATILDGEAFSPYPTR